MGGQGRRLDKGFSWQYSGCEEQARLGSGDVLGADDEVMEESSIQSFSEQSERNRNEEREGRQVVGKHKGGSISFTEQMLKKQANLSKRFSKSKHLEELHKY